MERRAWPQPSAPEEPVEKGKIAMKRQNGGLEMKEEGRKVEGGKREWKAGRARRIASPQLSDPEEPPRLERPRASKAGATSPSNDKKARARKEEDA